MLHVLHTVRAYACMSHNPHGQAERLGKENLFRTYVKCDCKEAVDDTILLACIIYTEIATHE